VYYPIKNGKRQATYRAFIEPVRQRKSLLIRKFAHVNKVRHAYTQFRVEFRQQVNRIYLKYILRTNKFLGSYQGEYERSLWSAIRSTWEVELRFRLKGSNLIGRDATNSKDSYVVRNWPICHIASTPCTFSAVEF
jgi:hypothetical protein